MNQPYPLNDSEKQALGYLEEVIDPEIGLNVVDLGLIYSITVLDSAHAINVRMTLTTQFCPMGASIVGSVEETLKEYFPQYEVEVSLTFEPRWDVGMISDAGRSFLER